MTTLAGLHAILRHPEPSTARFALELPTPYGPLRLDLQDAMAVMGHPAGLSAAEEEQAYQAFVAARDRFDPAAPEVSLNAMRAIVQRWPLWGGGHGALHDFYKFQGELDQALYHLRQLIALQPSYENLLNLGELLGRLERYEAATVVQEHLWATREAATPGIVEPSPRALAYRAACQLLVTLTRQQRGARMVQVADEALVHFGENSTLRYQQILGLTVDGRRDEARRQCAAALPRLPREDPMRPRFQQMAGLLGL